MRWRAGILLTVLLLGCSQRVGLTYRTAAEAPVVSSSLALRADKPAGAVGQLDASGLLGLLLKAELVEDYPATELKGEPYTCREDTRIKDIIRALEIRENWVYDPSSKAFYVATATHQMDEPDAFGRQSSLNPVPLTRRPLLAISFRFQNRSGGVQGSGGVGWTAAANVSGTGRTVEFCVPDGVSTTWADSEDRTYYEGVRDPGGSGLDRQVQTSLRKLAAGVQANLIAARLPGDGFRLDGTLTLSSFVGTGLDQKTISVPLQLDGPRHQWLQIFANEGVDISGETSVNAFAASAGIGRDSVFVLVRVD